MKKVLLMAILLASCSQKGNQVESVKTVETGEVKELLDLKVVEGSALDLDTDESINLSSLLDKTITYKIKITNPSVSTKNLPSDLTVQLQGPSEEDIPVVQKHNCSTSLGRFRSCEISLSLTSSIPIVGSGFVLIQGLQIPVSFDIQGSAVLPEANATVFPVIINFGEVQKNTVIKKAVEIKNNSASRMSLPISITNGNGVTVSAGTCGSTEIINLERYRSCKLDVSLTVDDLAEDTAINLSDFLVIKDVNVSIVALTKEPVKINNISLETIVSNKILDLSSPVTLDFWNNSASSSEMSFDFSSLDGKVSYSTNCPSTLSRYRRCSIKIFDPIVTFNSSISILGQSYTAQYSSGSYCPVASYQYISASGLYSNQYSFATLLEDGTIKVWGNASYGGVQAQVDALGFTSANPVKQIFNNKYTYATLLEDGTVKVWGHTSYGGDQAQVDALGFTSANPVKNIYSTSSAFAALLQDGTIKVWGHTSNGGDQAQVDALGFTSANPVKNIYPTGSAFAALLQDGTIKAWGNTTSGGDQSQVDALGFTSANPIKNIYSTGSAFATLLQDGTIKVWGNTSSGGNQSQVDALGITSANPLKNMFNNQYAFAILFQDGTIKVWGHTSYGGDQAQVDALGFTSANPVKNIYSTSSAFATLLQDGTIKVWGNTSSGGNQSQVDALGITSANPIKNIYPGGTSFAALLEDGTIKAWGNTTNGGDQSQVDALGITSANPVKDIYSNGTAFVALLQDGTIKAWGNTTNGGDQSQVDALGITSANPVKYIFNTSGGAFAVVLEDNTIRVWGNKNNGGDYDLSLDGIQQPDLLNLSFGESKCLITTECDEVYETPTDGLSCILPE